MIELITINFNDAKFQKRALNAKMVIKLDRLFSEHGLILRISIEWIGFSRWNQTKKKLEKISRPSILYEVYHPLKKIVLKSSIDDIREIYKWYINSYGTLFEKREMLTKF